MHLRVLPALWLTRNVMASQGYCVQSWLDLFFASWSNILRNNRIPFALNFLAVFPHIRFLSNAILK